MHGYSRDTERGQRGDVKAQQAEAVRVLLVEDSSIVADRVRESIREIPGVLVVDTLDRESLAVDTLARGGIDVVILDLHLNRGTGFGVIVHRDERKPAGTAGVTVRDHRHFFDLTMGRKLVLQPFLRCRKRKVANIQLHRAQLQNTRTDFRTSVAGL